MAARQIALAGAAVLRAAARPVLEVDESVARLLDDLRDTMRGAGGVGLAAPQIGILRRAIVVDDGRGAWELVNPAIAAQSGESVARESCLSLPGRRFWVRRFAEVFVTGRDRRGRPVEREARGLLARRLQHEIDHLNGVLLSDRAETERPECGEEMEPWNGRACSLWVLPLLP